MIFTICSGMFLVLVCLDMGFKQYIEDTFQKGEEKKTDLPNLVIRKRYNKGFALNFLERDPETVKMGSMLAGIIVFLYSLFVFVSPKKRVRKIGMTLVMAGTVSNLYDRMVRGEVIDYLGLKRKDHTKKELTFNIADLCIVIGCMIVSIARKLRK